MEELLYGSDKTLMDSAEFNALIEYQRPVHAEMAAITDAARLGIPIEDTILYTTTFPCHGCARHIVAAGIQRVVYIEPYAKSLARTLHSDSIAIDEMTPGRVHFVPFVGLAPRRYMELFKMGKRKDEHGKAVEWSPLLKRLLALGSWNNTLASINEEKMTKLFSNWQSSI